MFPHVAVDKMNISYLYIDVTRKLYNQSFYVMAENGNMHNDCFVQSFREIPQNFSQFAKCVDSRFTQRVLYTVISDVMLFVLFSLILMKLI